MNNNNNKNRRRIVLLFDLDCFYAQCERVRLGLESHETCSLALLQWNSVLAVTYPARDLYKIKRGDTWDQVSKKSNGECWSIHLKILDLKNDNNKKSNTGDSPFATVDAAAEEEEEAEDQNRDDINNDNNDFNNNDSNDIIDDDVANAYNRIYNLSKEQQLECQVNERGKRRYHYEGKACLERYRIASAMIFDTVLESLTAHLKGKEFVLERASIDEFYLDITKYCYNNNLNDEEEENQHSTAVIGNKNRNGSNNNTTYQAKPSSSSSSPRLGVAKFNDNDDEAKALQTACIVSNWIRSDVYKKLGFTMSTGISTNKMMAKLAASYGKPNGQAVLSPSNFAKVLNETKIRKVRNFGGKLGKRVIQLLKTHNGGSNSNGNDGDDDDTYMMGDLQQLPLPYLQQQLGGREDTSLSSTTTAQFVFDACRGWDQEPVKETTGALVKSITAFKSFPATKSIPEIQNWVSLLSNEIIDRVQKDTARNIRYPKSCTLKYSYYNTSTGQRPTTTSRRSRMESRSMRLQFPNYHTLMKQQNQTTGTTAKDTPATRRDPHPSNSSLVAQAMDHLRPILTQRPIRGVGLSASNFESRGVGSSKGSIDSFFNKAKTTASNKSKSKSAENYKQGIAETDYTKFNTSTAKMASSINFVTQKGSSRKRPAQSLVGGLVNFVRHDSTQEEQQSTMKDGVRVEVGLRSQKDSETSTMMSTGNRHSPQQQENQDPSSGCVDSTTKKILTSSATKDDCDDSNRDRVEDDNENDSLHLATLAAAGSHKEQQRQRPESSPCQQYHDDSNTANSDFEMAKRLQASFDRENDILSQVPNPTVSSSSKTKKKVRRIDTFFSAKRR